MAQILFYIALIVTSVCVLAAPWLTAAAYGLVSIVQPQYIWFWVLGDFPVFRVFAAFAILGLVVASLKKQANFSIYWQKQNVILVLLWIWLHLSDVFSPFPIYFAAVRADIVLNTLDSIMIMYLVVLPLVNTEKALMYLTYALVVAGLYYTYWCNKAYLDSAWYMFTNGRLDGPQRSPYRDGNVLSVLLVMSIPFITFYYFTAKHRLLKWGALLSLPFLFHALFLLGSRGALLSSGISLGLVAFFARSKQFSVALVLGFVAFLAYQGGAILNRTTSTVAQTSSSTNEPINPRLVSWEVGLKLIPEYPLLGAGVQRFQMASSYHFPGKSPHVAHNTFLQYAVDSGLPAGILFLSIAWVVFQRMRKIDRKTLDLNKPIHYCLVSSSIAYFGFFVCAVFLDLNIYEPIYYCLLINIIAWSHYSKQEDEQTHLYAQQLSNKEVKLANG